MPRIQQKDAQQVYTTVVWHKGLVKEIGSIDAYAQRMREIADWLAELVAAGISFVPGTTVYNGYAFLQTTDPVVAARYGFEAEEPDEDADDKDVLPVEGDERLPVAGLPAPEAAPAEAVVEVTLDDADPDDLARGPYVGMLSHRWFADGIDNMADYIERWREYARDVAAMAADGVEFADGAIVEDGSVDVTTTSLDVARRYQFLTQRQAYGDPENDEDA
jgi:hypothetical protein